MPQFEKRSCRPRDHLIAAGKLYPAAWKQIDQFRADRGTGGLPTWPDWCFAPLAAWYAIVSADAGRQMLDMNLIGDVGRLAAIGTWRVTQGIYRFDPSLYDAISATPVDGDLPCDVLYHLPEWCVYIETPGMQWFGDVLYGVFAHLEWDANTGRHELRLLLDGEEALQPFALHLGDWSLREAVDRMTREASRQAALRGATSPDSAPPELASALEPIMSLLLYLCSQNAEIGDGARRPENPRPKKTKHGWRLFAADKPTTWDVGVRIGAALRQAYQQQQTGAETQHGSPRPHIRRAHWHGYWTGPKNTPSERKLQLKWLPPVPVNLTDVDELPAVIRKIDR